MEGKKANNLTTGAADPKPPQPTKSEMEICKYCEGEITPNVNGEPQQKGFCCFRCMFDEAGFDWRNIPVGPSPLLSIPATGKKDITEMKVCARVCKACPFSTNCAPGWLGPHTIEAVLEGMQKEFPFACHLTIKEDTDDEAVMNGTLPVCRGWIASANASFKLFGTHPKYGPGLLALQKKVKAEGLEESGTILTRRNFREHHESKG